MRRQESSKTEKMFIRRPWILKCFSLQTSSSWILDVCGQAHVWCRRFVGKHGSLRLLLDICFHLLQYVWLKTDLRDSNGWGLIHHFVVSQDESQLKLYLEYCQVNDTFDNYGQSPLHLAVQYDDSHSSLVSLLLESESDPNRQDICGRTPLHWTIQNGSVEMTRLLLVKGANVYVCNHLMQSPLELAYWFTLNCEVAEDLKMLTRRRQVYELLLQYANKKEAHA